MKSLTRKELLAYLLISLIVLMVFISFIYFNFFAKNNAVSQLTEKERQIPIASSNPALIPDPQVQLGSLVVTSNPEKARITIDDSEEEVPESSPHVLIYQTPFRIEQISAGKHTLSVAKEGYEMQELEIDVLPNQINRISLALLPTDDGFLEQKEAWKSQLPITTPTYRIEYEESNDTVYVRMTIPASLGAQEYQEAVQNTEDETREQLKSLGISTSIQKVEWEIN